MERDRSASATTDGMGRRAMLGGLLCAAIVTAMSLVWLEPRWRNVGALFLVVVLALLLAVLRPRLRRWVVLGGLLFAAILALLPFFWLVCASVKGREDFFTYTFLPLYEPPGTEKLGVRIEDTPSTAAGAIDATGSRPFLGVAWGRLTLENFRRLFTEVGFARFIFNSLFVSSSYTCLVVLFASMAGFALAKYRFRGMRLIIAIMLGFVMIPGEILLAPTYELLYRIGWIDTLRALIVPGSISIFAIFLYRQSMLSIPDELLDAARVDGCSEFRIYWEIVLRLSRPMTGAIVLITFLWSWNSYLWPQIVLRSEANYTLPVVLSQMVGVYEQDYPIVMAGTLLAVLPVVVLFLMLQKEFISGLTRGAVKG